MTPASKPLVRILFCIPNMTGGGAEKIAAQVAANLDPSRFDVTLFAHERIGRYVGGFDDKVRVVYGSDQPYSRWRLPQLLLKTASLVRQSDVIVGANEGRATGLSLLCALILRKRFVSWIHCDWAEFGKYTSWRARLGLRASAWADAIVTVSSGAAAAFTRLVRVDPAKIVNIHNGIETENTRHLATAALTATDAELFCEPTIITVGRLHAQKNHKLLLRTHAAIRQLGIVHRLVILGEGPLLPELRALAAELGVADTVHFLGFQTNPYPYMRHATVFALTSLFEGMAIVLAEAMAVGTPAVTVDCPSGPAEVLGGGRYGVVVPLNDDQNLSQSLARVLTDPTYRQELSRVALEGAKRFDLKQTTASWEDLLMRLVGARVRVP